MKLSYLLGLVLVLVYNSCIVARAMFECAVYITMQACEEQLSVLTVQIRMTKIQPKQYLQILHIKPFYPRAAGQCRVILIRANAVIRKSF